MPTQHSEKLFQWPLQAVILQGYSVRLVPVDYSHVDQLSHWLAEEEIWRYLTFAYLASRDGLLNWIGSAMEANERGMELNFAIIDKASQSAVGTTSFYRVVPEHKRLERGRTWPRSFEMISRSAEMRWIASHWPLEKKSRLQRAADKTGRGQTIGCGG